MCVLDKMALFRIQPQFRWQRLLPFILKYVDAFPQKGLVILDCCVPFRSNCMACSCAKLPLPSGVLGVIGVRQYLDAFGRCVQS